MLKGYRTIIVNGLAALLALAVALGWLTVEQAAAIDPSVVADQVDTVSQTALNDQAKLAAGITAGLALVNLVLRVFTTTPAGKKS